MNHNYLNQTNECTLSDCFCREAQRLEARRSEPSSKTVNGHLLYTEQNCSVFHDSDKQCPVHEGGLTVCRLCREYEAGLDQPCRKVVEPPEQATPDSPALRRGRSILHHAEMVEEQVRRDNCGECSHAKDLHNGDHCWYPLPSRSGVKWCDCKCVFPVEQPPAQMTFGQHWQSAPKSIKHGCEETSAEFFYYAGRRDRETEMLREVNEVLSGVVGRIEQERVR